MSTPILGRFLSHSNPEPMRNDRGLRSAIASVTPQDVASSGPTIHQMQRRVAVCGSCGHTLGPEQVKVDGKGQKWIEGHRTIDCLAAQRAK